MNRWTFAEDTRKAWHGEALRLEFWISRLRDFGPNQRKEIVSTAMAAILRSKHKPKVHRWFFSSLDTVATSDLIFISISFSHRSLFCILFRFSHDLQVKNLFARVNFLRWLRKFNKSSRNVCEWWCRVRYNFDPSCNVFQNSSTMDRRRPTDIFQGLRRKRMWRRVNAFLLLCKVAWSRSSTAMSHAQISMKKYES